jgi:hypothetical protein
MGCADIKGEKLGDVRVEQQHVITIQISVLCFNTLRSYLNFLSTNYKRYGRINKESLFSKLFSILYVIVYCPLYIWRFVFWCSRPDTIIQSQVACSFLLFLKIEFTRRPHKRQRLIINKGPSSYNCVKRKVSQQLQYNNLHFLHTYKSASN